jgi:hypothetical protein
VQAISNGNGKAKAILGVRTALVAGILGSALLIGQPRMSWPCTRSISAHAWNGAVNYFHNIRLAFQLERHVEAIEREAASTCPALEQPSDTNRASLPQARAQQF